MPVRVKMRLMSKAPLPIGDPYLMGAELVMLPVPEGSAEGAQAFPFAQSRRCIVAVLDPAAAGEFEVGQHYYVEITPAEDSAPQPAPSELEDGDE